jgi:taurine transport system substrate-binding protein
LLFRGEVECDHESLEVVMVLQIRRVLFALLVCLAVALAACGDDDGDDGGGGGAEGQASTAMPDSITIGQYTLGNPYGIAIEKGWFEEEFAPTTVSFVEMNGPDQAIAGLASGDMDIALLGNPGIATALSQDINVEVPWIYEVIDTAEGLAVRDSAGIQSAADLKGKKIASPSGSTNHYALLKYLEQNGLGEDDLEIVDLGTNDILAAFQRGDIDGAQINEPVLGQLVKSGGRVLTSSGDLLNEGVFTADLAAVRPEFASEYPEAVRRYIAVLDRATRFYRSNPEESYEVMADYLSLEPAEVKQIMEGYRFLDAQEQASERWLGGGVATTISDVAQLWEELDRFPEAASEEEIREAVITDYLQPTGG